MSWITEMEEKTLSVNATEAKNEEYNKEEMPEREQITENESQPDIVMEEAQEMAVLSSDENEGHCEDLSDAANDSGVCNEEDDKEKNDVPSENSDETDFVRPLIPFDDEDTSEDSAEDVSVSNMLPNPKFVKLKRRRRIINIATKILSGFVWTCCIGLLLLCMSNLYQHIFNSAGYTGFFGIGQAVVASHSMHGVIEKNDLIFFKEVDVETLEPGKDIVVYEKQEDNQSILIVHSLISIEDGYAVTQGKNNSVADDPFPTSQIIGKYIFKIDRIGALLNLLSSKYALLIVLGIIALFFGLRILAYHLKKRYIVSMISDSKPTRAAIRHFFEI